MRVTGRGTGVARGGCPAWLVVCAGAALALALSCSKEKGSVPGSAGDERIEPSRPGSAAPTDPAFAGLPSGNDAGTGSTPVGVPSAPDTPGTFSPTPPPAPAELGLPQADDGTFVVVSAGDVELRYDPKPTPSPMTALALCMDWLMQCYDKAGQNMDECMAAVPVCTSEKPWEQSAACCPRRCGEQYLAQRAGEPQLRAFLSVFGEGLECIPEYARWRVGDWP